jgi:hypothetical protein
MGLSGGRKENIILFSEGACQRHPFFHKYIHELVQVETSREQYEQNIE